MKFVDGVELLPHQVIFINTLIEAINKHKNLLNMVSNRGSGVTVSLKILEALLACHEVPIVNITKTSKITIEL